MSHTRGPAEEPSSPRAYGISARFVRFLFAGGIAAVVNFGSRIGFSTVAPYWLAIVLAFWLGMATAFVLNREFVFQRSNKPLHSQALWFVVVNLVALAMTLGVSLVCAGWLLPALGLRWHVAEIAHAIGIVAPTLASYAGHRHLTFAQKL